jgi:hypothetical protein
MSEAAPSQTARREEIRAAIEADPTATNTAIAKRLNAARDTVIDVRRSLTGTTAPATDEAPEIDVFSLPVHPWAARFPMRADDDLDAMAQSIKANGLRIPVALGNAVLEAGTEPVLCVIDGRNRIAACQRANIRPDYVMLNGEDQDAFIADANLERRDLSKGQKAMLFAWRIPEASKGGRGKKALETSAFSRQRVGQARTVLQFCPEMVDSVIDGTIGLDDAYAEANRRKAVKQSHEGRFAELQAKDADLAELVREERISIANAEAELRDRIARAENELRSAIAQVRDFEQRIGSFHGVHAQKLAALYRDHHAEFTTGDLAGDIARWIEVLTAFQVEIENEQAAA